MSKWKTQNGSPVLSNENGQGHKKKYKLVTINKVIWDYLLFYKIAITVEYLLGVMNVEADRESMDLEGSSEWKLDTQVFKKICLARGIPNIEQGLGCIPNNLESDLHLCFSLFLL